MKKCFEKTISPSPAFIKRFNFHPNYQAHYLAFSEASWHYLPRRAGIEISWGRRQVMAAAYCAIVAPWTYLS